MIKAKCTNFVSIKLLFTETETWHFEGIMYRLWAYLRGRTFLTGNTHPECILRGLKISEHLGKQLESLNISFGKGAEIDIINAFCDGNVLTMIFGECKGSIVDYLSLFLK